MKRKGMAWIGGTLLLCTAGVMAALPTLPGLRPATAAPEENLESEAAVQPAIIAELPAATAESATAGITATRLNALDGPVFSDVELNAKAAEASPLTRGKGRRITAVSDLAGDFIMLYKSLTTTGGDGGLQVTVTTDGTNTITIKDFWQQTLNVTATVDVAAGTISIPAQKLYTHSTYGDMWLALCNNQGKPDYNKPLTGKINANGSFTIDSWWGVFVKTGTNAGSFMVAAYDTSFGRPNARMETTIMDGDPESYGIFVTQEIDNLVSVLNFGNYGMTVDITLNNNLTALIKQQVIREFPQNGDFMSYGCTGYKVDGTSVSFENLSSVINLNPVTTAQTTTLTWGPWTAISRGTQGSYLLERWMSGKITVTNPITFPSISVTEFKGAGTEADPYQISTLDDLKLLSQKVSESTEKNPNYPIYTSAFRGKYFKLMNDIDMSATNFTPIGAELKKRFAGHFDGNGKKISNLFIERDENYCALFGNVDTVASFKNVTMVNPKVTANAHYAGSLAGWTYGTTENCHVIGGEIMGAGQVCGGLIGAAADMTGCTAENVTVMALGGWGGGLAGQIVGNVSDCHAINASVYGYPGSGVNMGGLTGVFIGNGDNLSFTGTSDGYRLGAPDNVGVCNGAIAGVIENAKITNVYAAGTVLGRGTKCVVGGIFGKVIASTVENVAFHGRVGSYYSRMTGGLVGQCMAKSNDGKPVKSSLRNMYTASMVDLEDYQYNRETGWAETLGQVEENSLEVAENIYYNRQLFTENSANGTGLTTDQFTSGTPLTGFSADAWVFKAGQYPVLKKAAGSASADLAASAILLSEGANISKVNRNMKLTAVGNTTFSLVLNGKLSQKGHVSEIAGDSLKISTFGKDTLVFINKQSSFYFPMSIAPVPFEGIGSENQPYLIKTKADLIALAKFCNVDGQLFPETYFKQTNDIDLEYSPDFTGIANVSSDAHCRFAGIYDGGGYTSHRFKVPGLVWKTAPTETTLGTPLTGNGGCEGYKGFFGRLDVDGVLKNLNFAADCDALEAWASVGVAVGDNYGLIQNVRNYADITAVSCWVGGVAGMNEVEGRIIDCYNAGNVISGYNCAGGVAGRNNGLIENCANAGDVTIKKIANFGSNYNVAGGITTNMSNGILRNVLNVGTVEAVQTAGGLVASLVVHGTGNGPGKNDILGGVNLGTVRCPDMASCGYIAGFAPNNKRVDNNVTKICAYYDEQIANCEAYGNSSWEGMNGLSTVEMTSGNALEGLDAEYWQFDKGMYPVLKKFAAEPKLIAARQILLTLPAGVTVRNVTADGSLSDNATWKVEPATYFSVSGNTLKTGAAPQAMENAVLTGSFNGFNKPFDLTRIPNVPLKGEGTEAAPYLISSTDDWNNLAAYINGTHDNFDGKFLKITADLEFAAGTFMPLFSSTADFLMGTLDGDNHSVSGVSMTTTDRYQGPIREVGASGVIKNLTMKGKFSSAKAYTGAFTGNVRGKLINCVNEVELTLTSGSGASAFGQAYENAVFEKCVNKAHITGASTFVAGLVTDALANVTFTDCGNEGVIESKYSGSVATSRQGIAGLVATAISPKMTRCYNKGTIKLAKPEAMMGVAGILGYAKSNTTNKDSLVMDGCYNTVDLTAGYMVSGMVADIDGSATISNFMTFRNCYNTGNLTVNATTSKTNGCVAGISVMYTRGTKFENCYNTGTIRNDNPKQAYAAGIVAYYKTSPVADEPLTITGCHNTGEVTAVYNYASGIVSMYTGFGTVSDCYNTGNVSATIGAAGIAANAGNVNAQILRCWNSGNITVSDSRAGGIAGQNTFKSVMTDCFNTGNIVNTATAVTANATNKKASKGYGVGGVIGEGGGVMTRCYNMGNVKGIANVGGIVGRPYNTSTNLSSCYNAGIVDAPADSCGNIIGSKLTDNGLVWKPANNSVKDCYWVNVAPAPQVDKAAAVGVDNVEGIKEMTEAGLAALDMGEGWTNLPYTFPMLTNLTNDLAKVWAARVILADKDLATGIITEGFNIGAPEGLVWTSSIPANLKIDGNKTEWTNGYEGPFTMTATCGDFSRTVTLQGNVPSGIDGVNGDSQIVSEQFFTTDGVRVAAPENAGQVYIVVRKYADGTSDTRRIIAK